MSVYDYKYFRIYNFPKYPNDGLIIANKLSLRITRTIVETSAVILAFMLGGQ